MRSTITRTRMTTLQKTDQILHSEHWKGLNISLNVDLYPEIYLFALTGHVHTQKPPLCGHKH